MKNDQAEKKPFYRRKPRLFQAIFGLIFLLFLLMSVEGVLRWKGFVPGYLGTRPWEMLQIEAEETLQVDRWFQTGPDGIFVAIPGKFAQNRPHPIRVNAQGFRTPRFSTPDSGKTRVLFVGDSFTWGEDAEPFENCFVEKVGSAGFETINLGIPGAEPNQYLAVLQKYVPILQPDVVCCMFYLGNDLIYYDFPLRPFEHRYHNTNLGWLNPFLEGDYLGNAEETLEFYRKRYSIPRQNENGLNRFLAQTVLGTAIWKLKRKIWGAELDEEVRERSEKWKELKAEKPVTPGLLNEMETLCEAEKTPFFLFVIPEHGNPNPDLSATATEYFGNRPFHIPANLNQQDYRPFPDTHFNNTGHEKYADFILSILKTRGIRPGWKKSQFTQ